MEGLEFSDIDRDSELDFEFIYLDGKIIVESKLI